MTRPSLRQFDVVRNPYRDQRGGHPYLIILQSDLASGAETRVVAPLVSPNMARGTERLWPKVTVDGQQYVIAVITPAAVYTKDLGSPVANLEPDRYRIIRAVDIVFTGI